VLSVRPKRVGELNKVYTAVILVSAEGLRLRPLTLDMPKAMVLVAGIPL
jgi:choline kinase